MHNHTYTHLQNQEVKALRKYWSKKYAKRRSRQPVKDRAFHFLVLGVVLLALFDTLLSLLTTP